MASKQANGKSFEWYLTSLTSEEMTIKVDFSSPAEVSFGQEDKLKLNLNVPSFFEGEDGKKPSREFRQDEKMYPEISQSVYIQKQMSEEEYVQI